MTHEVLHRADGATIAYERLTGERRAGRSPGVVFLHGLMSDRRGTKAQALAEHCVRKGYSCLRFDMYGHGDSSGRFEEGSITRWTEDTLAVLDALTEGPQILVGSSMGGWVMLRAALARANRIAGMIGIAAAPDFTQDLMWQQFSPAQRETLATQGVIEIPSEYNDGPYRISRHLIEDGARNRLLGGTIATRCPLRLLHGQRDDSVPWQRALLIADKVAAEDVEMVLVKDGDHRLSRPQDLARLCAVLDSLIAQIAGV